MDGEFGRIWNSEPGKSLNIVNSGFLHLRFERWQEPYQKLGYRLLKWHSVHMVLLGLLHKINKIELLMESWTMIQRTTRSGMPGRVKLLLHIAMKLKTPRYFRCQVSGQKSEALCTAGSIAGLVGLFLSLRAKTMPSWAPDTRYWAVGLSVCHVPCGTLALIKFFFVVYPLLSIEMRMFILCHCILEVCKHFFLLYKN